MVAKVFVASLPTRYDAATQADVPSLDLNPATDHGELTIVTRGPQRTGDELDNALMDVYSMLRDNYNYGRGDCILMVGDPILNGVAMSAALDGGRDKGDHPNDWEPIVVLRWNRREHKYDKVEIEP